MQDQTKREEFFNTLTHGLGVVFGLIGFVALLKSVNTTQPYALFSVFIYGSSIIILFLASTLYHAVMHPKQKHYFRIADHISIYILIAGTYTPVLLISSSDSMGWPLFYTVWGIAAFGVLLKLFFTGKFETFSTLLYLVMGWIIVFDYTHVAQVIGTDGVFWLSAGGLFYTLGIVFYAVKKIPYNHVIWHLFVLGGAISHFLMIYWHVI